MLTYFRESLFCEHLRNPVLSNVQHDGAVLENRGNTAMKSFVVLTAVVVLTVGNAIAAMPGAASTASKSAQPVVMMAEQELPFDRYWSKN